MLDGAEKMNEKVTEKENVTVDSQRNSSVFSIPTIMADLVTNLTKGGSSRNATEVDNSKSLPKGPDKRHVSESSDESEFEILNTDELNVN